MAEHLVVSGYVEESKEKWKTVKVGSIGKIITGKTPKTTVTENYGGIVPFLTPSDDMDAKYVSKTSRTLSAIGVQTVKNFLLPANSVCVSCIGSDLGKVVITTEPTVTNQQINSIIVDTECFDVSFVYYAMVILGKHLNVISKASTTVPIVNKSRFSDYEIVCPPLQIQKKVASILSVLDEKIALNNQVNDNLQQQTLAIFQQELLRDGELPEGWSSGSLLDVANYLNGLAMQKYRPDDGENGLPVLKIKELRQGCCDASSELCSPNIKPEYIVHDGDVIFSWSGSLLVDLWCGGTCGLNQHLFKVTSDKYPKWFYYAWTARHLDRFIAIAADKATTMGHIKREELAKAEVVIPDVASMERIGGILQPMYDLIISNRIENRKLAALRDTILPQLMSGELDVNDLT